MGRRRDGKRIDEEVDQGEMRSRRMDNGKEEQGEGVERTVD